MEQVPGEKKEIVGHPEPDDKKVIPKEKAKRRSRLSDKSGVIVGRILPKRITGETVIEQKPKESWKETEGEPEPKDVE